MGYVLNPKIRIDLSHLGTDSANNAFFVEIRNPKVLPFERKMELAQAAQSMKENAATGSQELKVIVQKFITSWNLIDVDTEQPVDPQAADALDHVPSEVVESILGEFKKLAPKEDEATKNS